MGALQLTPSRAGTIRRVIRRGSHFICGLCRSSYGDEGTAQSCIQGCWTELLSLDPVIIKRRLVGVAYRCRFCARDYAKRPDAAACAEECKSHQLRLHEAEQSLTEQSDDPPPRKRLGKPAAKLKAVKTVPAPASPLKPASKKVKSPAHETALPNPINADVVASPSSPSSSDATRSADGTAGRADGGGHGGSGAGGGSAADVKESEMIHGIGTGSYSKKPDEQAIHGVGSGSYSKKPEVEGAGKPMQSSPKKLKTSEAFYRDGARYVCHGCQAKYFTRGEVETCFAGHK